MKTKNISNTVFGSSSWVPFNCLEPWYLLTPFPSKYVIAVCTCDGNKLRTNLPVSNLCMALLFPTTNVRLGELPPQRRIQNVHLNTFQGKLEVSRDSDQGRTSFIPIRLKKTYYGVKQVRIQIGNMWKFKKLGPQKTYSKAKYHFNSPTTFGVDCESPNRFGELKVFSNISVSTSFPTKGLDPCPLQ